MAIPVSGEGRGSDFEVGKPYGTDSYFLLTSLERIDNPDVFEFDGVVTSRGSERGAIGGNPLSRLLSEVGTLSRGVSAAVPTDWDVEKVQLRSLPPAMRFSDREKLAQWFTRGRQAA